MLGESLHLEAFSSLLERILHTHISGVVFRLTIDFGAAIQEKRKPIHIGKLNPYTRSPLIGSLARRAGRKCTHLSAESATVRAAAKQGFIDPANPSIKG